MSSHVVDVKLPCSQMLSVSECFLVSHLGVGSHRCMKYQISLYI